MADITDKSATNVLATTIKHKSPDKITKSFNLFGKFRAVYYFTLLMTKALYTVLYTRSLNVTLLLLGFIRGFGSGIFDKIEVSNEHP